MNRFFTALSLTTIALVCFAAGARAEHHEEMAPTAGFRADLLKDMGDVEKKVIDLANAVPADKYSWAPTPEVRNTAASYVHMAQSNHQVLRALGIEPPEGAGEMEETITEKDEVIAALEASFAALSKAIKSVSDDDLDTMVPFFGREWSKRHVLMLLAGHFHEHLGQAIVYARSVGVVPPWSRPRDDSGDGNG